MLPIQKAAHCAIAQDKGMKVAIIGTGRMGSLHASLLRQMTDVDQLLLVDQDLATARRAATTVGGVALDDPRAALDVADAAIVATHPDSHAEFVQAAVERGRPVLCEKPLAPDVSQATTLARRVERSGIPVQVGLHRRFDPGLVAARSLIEHGSLGRLQLIRLEGTEPGLPPSELTNIFRNTAVHDFDLVRWLSGDEVTSVFAAGARREGGSFDPKLDPDTIVVTLQLSRGTLGVVSVSRLSPLGYDVRAELLGSTDHVSIGWTDRSPIHAVERPGEPLRPDAWRTWQQRFEDAYRAELTAFLEVAAGRRSVPVTMQDAIAAQRIGEAARRSMEAGLPVALEAGR